MNLAIGIGVDLMCAIGVLGYMIWYERWCNSGTGER